MTEKFSAAVASHSIATDYGKLDCIASILTGLFSRSQPLAFWKALFPVFNSIFNLHGATLMARENDRFLKQVAFHLLRLAVFRNNSIRRRAVVGLQILVRVSYQLCCDLQLGGFLQEQPTKFLVLLILICFFRFHEFGLKYFMD